MPLILQLCITGSLASKLEIKQCYTSPYANHTKYYFRIIVNMVHPLILVHNGAIKHL